MGSINNNVQNLLTSYARDIRSHNTPSSKLQTENQDLLKAIANDSALDPSTRSTLSNDVQQLLPMSEDPSASSAVDHMMDEIRQLLQDVGQWNPSSHGSPTSTAPSAAYGNWGHGNAPSTYAPETAAPTTNAPQGNGQGTPSLSSGAPATPQTGTESLYPGGSPSAADVNQRGIGDCALMSTLADVVNKDPSAITNAISSDGHGGYNVTLYPNGQKTTVDVSPDDIKKNGNVSSTGSGSDWASVMEAAALKVDPSIANGADPGKMMQLVTGKAGTDQSTASLGGTAGTAAAIQKALSNGGVMDATSTNGGTTSDGTQIVGDHAYSVLGISGDQVTVRNPWGQGQANDGVITMSVEDFNKIFDGVQSN